MNNYEQRGNRNNFRDDGDKTQLFFAKGRNDGMDPQSVAEFISSQTNIPEDEISNIKVLDAFSFFAVSHDDAKMILDFFQDKAGDARPLVSRAKRKSDSGSGNGDRNRFNNSSNNYRNDRVNNNRRDFNGGNGRRGS